MGKQRKGILDGFDGTVGPAIGYSWRGKDCLRAHPTAVKNPRTADQVRARHRFTECVRLASHMGAALRVALHRASLQRHMTENNLFLRLNNECFDWQDERLTVDYARLLLAQGPLAPLRFGSPAMEAGRRISVPFSTVEDFPAGKYTDFVYLYAWCPSAQDGTLAPPVYRYQEAVSLLLPAHWEDSPVWLYGWAQEIDGLTSYSCCIGTLDGQGHHSW